MRTEQAAKAQKIVAAENTYFKLLEARISILEELKITITVPSMNGGSKRELKGREAISALVEVFQPGETAYYPGLVNWDEYVGNGLTSRIDEIGHYLRFTYHIIKFAESEFGNSAYEYVRILRAQLSDSEQVLIALNCAFAGGQGAFKKYIYNFTFLNNLSDARRAIFELDRLYELEAFERKTTE